MPLPPSVLTPLDVARAALLDGLSMVAATDVALSEARGLTAAPVPPLAVPVPSAPQAAKDGWAVASADIAGASSYAPVVLAATPSWISAGEALPASCDCVLDPGLLSDEGPFAEVFGEARPGEGTRPIGSDIGSDAGHITAGRRIDAYDLAACRRAGLETLSVLRPHVRIINTTGRGADRTTCEMTRDWLRAFGVLTSVEECPNQAQEIVAAIRSAAADLVIAIGGTGFGDEDRTVEALATSGMLVAHGLAMAPGRTTVTGRHEGRPIVALPGLPEQALGGLLALVEPVIRRLGACGAAASATRPLARKISSAIGVADVALLESRDTEWMPLAVGDLTLASVRRADAWALIPAGSEGLGAGSLLKASLLRPGDFAGS